MEKVKIGLIGCGVHAMRDIYPMLAKVNQMELIAVCDRNIDKVKRCASLFGIKKKYTNHEDMVSSEKMDAVIIIGPPAMHYELGKYCLDHGLHIFIEKPSATTVNKALELSKKAEKVNKFGQVGHFLRHSSAHQLAKKIITSEEFGKPVMINCAYYSKGPWEARSAWGVDDQLWTYMLVQGVHLIDIAQHFMGDIVSVKSVGNVTIKGRAIFSVSTQFESGAIGAMSFNASSPNWRTAIDIIGENNSIVSIHNGMTLKYENIDNWSNKFDFDDPVLSRTYESGTNYNSKPSFGYLGQLEHFVKSILSGREPCSSLYDEYKALKIAEEIIQNQIAG